MALDTQLLVLLVVGLIDPELVEKHKRTRAYTRADFVLLVEILENMERIVVTPHVLAETSNFLGEDDKRGRSLRAKLAELIGIHHEKHVPAVEVVREPNYLRLGIADSGLLSVLGADTILLTGDLALYLAAAARQPLSQNFNHLRLSNLLG